MNEQQMFTLYIIGFLALTLMFIAGCYAFAFKVAFSKATGDVTPAITSFITGTSVQFATVVIIVVAVFILRLNGLLEAEGTVSILSGVVGYVLGGVAHPRGSATATDGPLSPRPGSN
jgi:hypothetical protein